MRCLTMLVMLLLIAVVGVTGYNYMQVSRMSRDLSAIKAAVQPGSPLGDPDDLAATLASANRHVTRAKNFLAEGKTKAAHIELNKSLTDLEKAAKLSKYANKEASKSLTDRVSKVQKQFQETLETLSKQPTKE